MLFIVNPISGHGRKKRIISHLTEAGYKVVCTEYAGYYNIYHTVLNFLGLETPFYDESKNIFK